MVRVYCCQWLGGERPRADASLFSAGDVCDGSGATASREQYILHVHCIACAQTHRGDAHSPTNLTLILFWISEVDDIAEVCGSFLVALELFFEQVCIPSELSHHSK